MLFRGARKSNKWRPFTMFTAPAEAVQPFSQNAGKWLSEHLFLQNFKGGAYICPLSPPEQACITAGPILLCFRRACVYTDYSLPARFEFVIIYSFLM